MNILLIAPYRTYSGWGEGSKNLAKALNTLNHNLAIRPVYMSNEIEHEFTDMELLELEATSYDNYDVVIQRVLPNYFQKISNVINVLACVFETGNIKTTPWWRYLTLADSIFVPSYQEKKNLLANKLQTPINVVSEAIDISKYDQHYEPLKDLQGVFNFYFIGEFIERKNLTALLTAFHREFKSTELVNLVIKTSGNIEFINNTISKIKQELCIYHNLNNYKKEFIICNRMSEQGLNSLHKSCHCFVMPSYGEAYCRPAVDALGFGNTPIVTDNTGMVDYINNDNGWVVPSRIEPVYTNNKPLPYIYTSKENWASIDILSLMRCMREAYESKQKKQQPNMEQFSYKTIGQNLDRVLNVITNQ